MKLDSTVGIESKSSFDIKESALSKDSFDVGVTRAGSFSLRAFSVEGIKAPILLAEWDGMASLVGTA